MLFDFISPELTDLLTNLMNQTNTDLLINLMNYTGGEEDTFHKLALKSQEVLKINIIT